MEFDLTPEQADYVRHAVEAGRFSEPAQAVQQAMALWVERERKRADFVATLDASDASIARGEGIPITNDSMRQLARDVIERNRYRFATE